MNPHPRRAAGWALAVSLGLSACAAPPPEVPAESEATAVTRPNEAEDRAAIEAILATYDQVVTGMDEDLFLTLWDDTAELSVVSPVGRVRSPEELAGFFQGLRDAYQELNIEFSNVSIRVDGDAARSTFDWAADAVLADGSPLQFSGWETQVYRRRPDGWRITHLHYSVPAAGAPAE